MPAKTVPMSHRCAASHCGLFVKNYFKTCPCCSSMNCLPREIGQIDGARNAQGVVSHGNGKKQGGNAERRTRRSAFIA